MKVTEHLATAKDRSIVSFEILPPLKGGSMSDIFKVLDPLMEFKPPFIDVTYHREEYIYKQRESGYYEKTAIRKRPGTVGICTALMHHYQVDTVPHLICGGFNIEDTENALIDLNFLGINNVLALRGDGRKFDGKFIPEEGGHHFAKDLVNQMSEMNRGVYLDEKIENGTKTDFCIGVAGYPEKHFEAANLELDIKHLKAKIEAGADYVVTQMFFDNQKYFDFVAACRAAGIDVPIIPGLKPISSGKQLISLPRAFYLNIPDTLASEISKATNRDQIREIGIQWCIEQSKELLAKGAPCIHYYTMGDAKTIHKIVSNVL